MSMSLLTLFQFLGTLSAYLLVTMALPCAVLSKKLSRYRFMERALLYFIIGNFYVTNLVLLLELLHISNRFTILLGLLVIPGAIGCRLNQFPFADAMKSFGLTFRKLLTGSLGLRSAANGLRKKIWGRVAGALRKIGNSIREDWPDWLLTLALIVMVVFVYGLRMVRDFGYTMSDIPVHMYWVNGLSENALFMEGIYPFGMHVMIYLLHMVFGIDTYVIFRVFSLVQCFAIHIMALLFLRLCCKSRFAAYTGVFVYTIGSYVASTNLIRYLSTLPQETSMIYMLPTVYFVFMFFREKRGECESAKALKKAETATEAAVADEPVEPEQTEPELLEALEPAELPELVEAAEPAESETAVMAEEAPKAKGLRRLKGRFGRSKKERKPISMTASGVALAGLAMSFSLCLTAHTYGASIAALFCIGVAVAHIGWFIRPAYFTRLMAAALVSVAVTVFPMGVSYLMGTPIQGSFDWAVGVIADSVQKEEEAMPPAPVETAPDEASAGGAVGGASAPVEGAEVPTPRAPTVLEKVAKRLERVKERGLTLWDSTGARIESRVLGFSYKPSVVLGTYVRWSAVLRAMIVILLVAGIALQPFRRVRLYGAMLLSTGIFMTLMSLLISADMLGLPMLMDLERVAVFYSYMLIVVIGFAVDACLFVLSSLLGKHWNEDVLSFAVVTLVVIFLWQEGDFRASLARDGLETNEAIACLTNIIATEEDNTWTIFSANDETQMVYGHGYHYELSVFLEEIAPADREPITVPTPTVYFFIEKIPLDYVGTYWGSGQAVSTKGAQRPVPEALGQGAYLGENRWIIMSHMYYWAQEFQRMYPNEMSVYMETDQFVCYRLEQNAYRLFDLGIDYGYNSKAS